MEVLLSISSKTNQSNKRENNMTTATTTDLNNAQEDGYNASSIGNSINVNPHAEGSQLAVYWDNGWYEAESNVMTSY